MPKTPPVLGLVAVSKRFVAPDGVSPLTAIDRISFDVRSGAFVDAPEIRVATYPVRIDDGDVLVDLDGGAA